jgi:NADH-quinone oxidoreductase subunit L
VVSFTSVLLVVSGFGFVYIRSRKASHHNTDADILPRWALADPANSLDRIIDVLSERYIELSKTVARFDQSFIDRIVNYSSVGIVILAHIVGWFDRYVVDGFINALATLAKFTGKRLGNLQGGYLREYIIMVLFILLLVLLFLIF